MPDFGNLLDPNIEISSESDSQIQALIVSDPNTQMGFPILHKEDELKLENRVLRQCGGGSVAKRSLDDYVKDWVQRKVNAGVDKNNCFLPFLVHAPKLVECSVCQRLIFPGEEVGCSVRDCMGVFHLKCARERLGLSSPKTFKCPQH
ncbi:histone-lysine n-methyltransferase ashr3, partial [Nicotiana attenuata]